MSKGKHVLGDLTTRLAAEFAQEGSAEALTPPIHRARAAPSQLMEFTGVSNQLADATRELEELRKENAGGFEVALENLREGPYHVGPLVEERVVGLVDNFRNNPLSTPVVVRPTPHQGVFEIVGGRHRVEAFRRLGRTHISAVLRKLEDDEAERVVFYDNLLAPSLCDYEKYLGFSKRQKSKGLTQEQLAAEAGVDRSFVAFVLAFDRLAPAAQELIRQNPRKPGMGANLFQAMSALSGSHPTRVVEAVQRVIDGKLTASNAATWVTGADRVRTEAAATRVLLKRGKQTFAEVRSRGSQWVVNFASPDDAEDFGKRLLGYLEQESQAKASAK